MRGQEQDEAGEEADEKTTRTRARPRRHDARGKKLLCVLGPVQRLERGEGEVGSHAVSVE